NVEAALYDEIQIRRAEAVRKDQSFRGQTLNPNLSICSFERFGRTLDLESAKLQVDQRALGVAALFNFGIGNDNPREHSALGQSPKVRIFGYAKVVCRFPAHHLAIQLLGARAASHDDDFFSFLMPNQTANDRPQNNESEYQRTGRRGRSCIAG